jgi:hypothetical protein
MATKHVAAEVVDDSERKTVAAIAHQEFTLKIHGPNLVGCSGVEGSGSGMFPAAANSTRPNAAMSLENVENRAASGQGPMRKTPLESLQDLPSAPPVLAVLLENAFDKLVGSLMRTRPWCSTAVVQSTDSALTEAVKPLVAGDPADAVSQAQLRHVPVTTLEVLNKMLSFEHWIGLHPRHSTSLRIELGGSVSHVPGRP